MRGPRGGEIRATTVVAVRRDGRVAVGGDGQVTLGDTVVKTNAKKVRELKDAEGFNALTEVYEDLVKAGVIDPTKVVRSALQNSSSIASLLLTTEALICEIPEEKKETPPMPGGGGMGGMY